MNGPIAFGDVQRIVLRGANWLAARHFAFDFGAWRAAPLNFLHSLHKRDLWPTAVDKARHPSVQTSLGLTRRGLEQAKVPAHVLACFALKAPAFHAGAALRAAKHLGMVGAEAPGTWAPGFAFTTLAGVVSLHADTEKSLDRAAGQVLDAALQAGVPMQELQRADRLPPHPKYTPQVSAAQRDGPAMWVHFGYRDGIARVGIEGWSDHKALEECEPVSIHAAGEFVLGHPQNCGGNPWIAGPGRRVWPEPLRNFFHNGSFGVLQQVEQDVMAFEDFVSRSAALHPLGGNSEDELKAKLCGRYPDGRRIGRPGGPQPEPDFDYADDPQGASCPFGAHVRRMNPRESGTGLAGAPGLAHFSRARPLLRRGLPYGPDAWAGAYAGDPERGLMAQFFCASIEDQYEHLIGQWADRVPLGSADRGGARDPFSGAHDGGDGPFEIPRQGGQGALRLTGLAPFTRTRGVAYLFYPSRTTLWQIAKGEPWLERDEGVA
jgi:deferrochelatase/peroxidase EfeB